MARRCQETFKVRAFGPLACFTRPEFKVERVSYDVMTPSAARGLLEAVYWKPAIRWVVTSIHVLEPIRFIGMKRNEVARRVSTADARSWMRGAEVEPFFADNTDDKARAQRHTLALRKVDYVIEAHFHTTDRWGPEDNMPKHVETFERRLGKGQTYQQPYFGCREFAAAVEPAPPSWETRIPAEELPRVLGPMLYDIEHGAVKRPRFFNAFLDESGRMGISAPDGGGAT